ncbi:MAG: TnpV protein [Candidatus Faecousia sp.]|nr:TnpV protein [Clostridiales bacterium]MDY6181301.1 TnpV protein [Candidatus Faecousia sp.]
MQYIRVGDYYIPDLELPQETRPIGKWGRMHRDYLREHKPIQYNCLLLSGKLWTHLADLNEQAQDRLERIIDQMKAADGITEALKASDPMAWVGAMNNIRFRAEAIIREELIFV